MASSEVAGTAPAGPPPWPLRAYHAHVRALGPLLEWQAELERVRALEFDTLVLAGVFEAPHDPSHSLVDDPAHPSATVQRESTEALFGALVREATRFGLGLMLDVRLDRAPLDGALARQHGAALAEPALAIDPRPGPAAEAGAPLRWWDAEQVATLEDWWSQTLAGWAQAGVAGFMWHEPKRVPAPSIGRITARVRAAAPGTRFVALTAGHSTEEVRALEGQGLSAVVSSLPWWDYRAAWFCEECERLGQVAPVLHALDTLATHAQGAADGRVAVDAPYRRALWSAAALGAGFIMPMGFECGVPATLDAHPLSRADWLKARANAAFDLSGEVVRANRWLAGEWQDACDGAFALYPLTGPEAALTALVRQRPAASPTLVVINAQLQPAAIETTQLVSELPVPAARLVRIDAESGPGAGVAAGAPLGLLPCEAALFRLVAAAPIRPFAHVQASQAEQRLAHAMKAPRIVVSGVTPQSEHGRFAVRRVVGEAVVVEADVFVDGHDELAVALRWRPVDASAWFEERMAALPNDRYRAQFVPDRLGRYEFVIEAWIDLYGTWLSETRKKRSAGQTLTLEAGEGRVLIEAAQARAPDPVLETLLARLALLAPADWGEALDRMADRAVVKAMTRADTPAFLVRSAAAFPVEAERRAAQFAAWYELFPRSLSPTPGAHGTLRDVIARLPAIRAMGFDVLYFPPIHPIGFSHRKGRNNALEAAPGEPGSPYAIGAPSGGHEAIHPELGSFEDFAALVQAAAQHGLEIALDFAVQCSPDHPWLEHHPEWFSFRADGSLRYAENPPKKYEDIVNVDFYTTRATPTEPHPAARLWQALCDVVLFWVSQGVRIFRVDNPHTKPLPFWEWLIGEVRGRHPDVIFLAEAFTRPKMMARLAQIGFSQSYTYFTWRNSKSELTEYLTELSTSAWADVYRPHFFVNTPDINPFFLQTAGRAGFVIRAALAAFLSGLWGMYSGFECCEAEALPGREEYLDSEKYQLRQRDFDAPGNIVAEITALNRIRRANPALHRHGGVSFYNFFNDQVLYFGRATAARDNVVLCAISLDPHQAQEGDFEVPLWEFGLSDLGALRAEDLYDGHRFVWTGKRQHLRLDPTVRPFAVWRIWR